MWRFTEFDGLALPAYNWRQDQSSFRAPVTLQQTLNGAYDFYQNARVIDGVQTFQVSGMVDNASPATYIASLKAKVGKLGTLKRADYDGSNVRTKDCRLLQVQYTPTAQGGLGVHMVTLTFSTAYPFWKATSATTYTTTLSSGANSKTVTVAGEEKVIEVSFKVTRTSGTITKIDVTNTTTGATWYWQDTVSGLTASQYFQLQSGAYYVDRSGSPDYAHFFFNSSHTDLYWLSLEPGNNSFSITLTGGGASLEIVYTNTYP